MAKRGRKFVFHGAFGSKRKAIKRERKGQFILRASVKGKSRFVLVSKRRK